MDYDDILKRAELKYFGAYILHGSAPGPLITDHDRSREEMEQSAYAKIEEALSEALDERKTGRLLDAINELDADIYRIGFMTGMKVGARLILNLTGDRKIIM